MKCVHVLFLSLFVSLATGCAHVNLKENLITLDKEYFVSEQPGLRSYITGADADPLKRAYQQVMSSHSDISNVTKATSAAASTDEPLPSYMAKEPLVQKIVIAAYEALINESDSTITVSKGDISSMTKMLNESFVVGPANVAFAKSDSDKKVNKIISKYLGAYYSDSEGFVNREGTVFKRPEIRNSIGNDVITAVTAISLEGLFDGLLDTPVYVDKDDKFQTSDGREPSVYRYGFTAKREKIVDEGSQGIDELELKAIRYLSGLAGDQSKTLSGAAYRSFGGLELSFVIGGKFSFGDNETLAKILDTSFEVASKRIAEESAYRGFLKLNAKYPATSSEVDSRAKILLQSIE